MRNLNAGIVFIAVILLALFLPSTSLAWIDTGHKIIATIIWDQLTPQARVKCTDILKKHPRYEQDLLQNLPAGATEDEKDKYAFLMASTWPDMVRSQGNPMHTLYNHPSWHYIDIPYVLDGQPMPATRPSTGDGPSDIVSALTKNVADFKNPDTAPADRAVALCWILHLCGDIHQPLHGVQLVSKQFPDGDQGGNALIVLRDPPYTNSAMNLHLIWDQMPGEYKSTEAISYMAHGLEIDPLYTREKLKDELAVQDFAAWAMESHDLAVKYVYLDGTLKAATKDALRDPEAKIPGLPNGYIRDAEAVAFKRVILAGYRTSDLLNGILDKH